MKKIIKILLLGIVSFVFISCESEAKQGEKSEIRNNEKISYPIKLIDHAGRKVIIKKPAEKIVSAYYVSSALLVGLGLEDKVSGIEMRGKTRELYKRSAPRFLDLPGIGNGKGVNVEEVAKLNPDLVVIPLRLKDTALMFEELGINTIVVNPETLELLMESIEILGKATGTTTRASQIIEYYTQKINKIEKITEDIQEKPSIYIAGVGSYLTTPTSKMYQSELVRMAGGYMVSSELQDSYWTSISLEQLLKWNPEYIFMVNYSRYKLENIMSDNILKTLRGIEEKNVHEIPSKIESWDYPTPSSILGVLWLTNKLYPELYTEEEYIVEAKTFYKKFFDIEVTLEDIGVQ